jgi:hypothetical protein
VVPHRVQHAKGFEACRSYKVIRKAQCREIAKNNTRSKKDMIC